MCMTLVSTTPAYRTTADLGRGLALLHELFASETDPRAGIPLATGDAPGVQIRLWRDEAMRLLVEISPNAEEGE